jgi:hypothetical protein
MTRAQIEQAFYCKVTDKEPTKCRCRPPLRVFLSLQLNQYTSKTIFGEKKKRLKPIFLPGPEPESNRLPALNLVDDFLWNAGADHRYRPCFFCI